MKSHKVPIQVLLYTVNISKSKSLQSHILCFASVEKICLKYCLQLFHTCIFLQLVTGFVSTYKYLIVRLTEVCVSPLKPGAPNGNFRENICSEDDLRSRIFGAFVVKFLACLPLLEFSNIYKMVKLPIFNGF